MINGKGRYNIRNLFKVLKIFKKIIYEKYILWNVLLKF